MKSGYVLLALLLLQVAALAQWKQTNGIAGAYYTNLNGVGDVTLASTSYGTIIRTEGGIAQKVAKLVTSPDNILKFDTAWLMISGNLLYRSDDGGVTWTEKTLPFYPQRDITFQDSLLVGFVSDTAYISSDLGNTWQKERAGGDLTFTDSLGNTFTGFIYAPQAIRISGGVIYVAGFSTIQGLFSGMFKRTIGDTLWHAIPLPASNITHVLSFTQFNGKLYISTSLGVFRTTESGRWEAVNEGLPVSSGNSFTAQTIKAAGNQLYIIVNTTPSGLYFYNNGVWVHAGLSGFPSSVEISDGVVYATVAGSLYKNNGAGDWQTFGQDVIASTSNALPMNRDTVFSIYKGYLYRTYSGGMEWHIADSGKSQISFGSKNRVFSLGASGIYRSSDLGSTWQLINGNLPGSYIEKKSAIVEMDGVLYAGFNGTRARMHLPPVWEQGGIYRSFDGGETWQPFHNGLPYEGNVPAPVYSITVKDKMILLRTIKGYFVLKAGSWTSLESAIPAESYIRDITYFDDNIYVLAYKGCFKIDPVTFQMDSVNTGLQWVNGYNYYSVFMTYGDSLFIYGRYGTDHVLKLENNAWNASDFNAADFNNFTSVNSIGDLLYAGTYDMGIWKYGGEPVTGLEETAAPKDFTLEQNYPNPFNPATTIRYRLPVDGMVKLEIFDLTGSRVLTAVDEFKPAGSYTYVFSGSGLSSGTYIYRLSSNGKNLIRKFILLK